MGVSISIIHRKEIICPNCGVIVGHTDVTSVDSGGSVWYKVLESLGYYVPYEQRTEENDWYGKDMVLTAEQAKEVYGHIVKSDVYGRDEICVLIATAVFENDIVVVNADW